MNAMLVSPGTSHLFFEKLGQKVAYRQELGLCQDGRILVVQKDKNGTIIGLELE